MKRILPIFLLISTLVTSSTLNGMNAKVLVAVAASACITRLSISSWLDFIKDDSPCNFQDSIIRSPCVPLLPSLCTLINGALFKETYVSFQENRAASHVENKQPHIQLLSFEQEDELYQPKVLSRSGHQQRLLRKKRRK